MMMKLLTSPRFYVNLAIIAGGLGTCFEPVYAKYFAAVVLMANGLAASWSRTDDEIKSSQITRNL
jgi:hypothetical protein